MSQREKNTGVSNEVHRVERPSDSLVHVLQWRAAHQPNEQAFTFLADDDTETVFSYAKLDALARCVAVSLTEHTRPGDRVLLLLPPGIEYVASLFGCFYAGCMAVPAYPPRRNSTLDRLVSIAKDTAATVAISTQAIISANTSLMELGGNQLAVLAAEQFSEAQADDFESAPVLSADIALLQYTSGSTETPRGVMVSHSNLMNNSAFIEELYQHTSTCQGVIWLPPYHDMGLIGGVLQPIYAGFPCTLMPPMSFLQRPLRWLRNIGRYGGTTSGGPNFAYDLCLRRVKPEQREELDLSSWSVAFNGAEPISAETLDRFAEYFAPCGFRRDAFLPCYGLAEATLMVSGIHRDAAPTLRTVSVRALQEHRIASATDEVDERRIVGCGRWMSDHDVLVVDESTHEECAAGRVGEIWVRGPSVARGYWERREASAATFEARRAGRDGQDGQPESYLRTGDLGLLVDGELFVVGRRKEVLIIRGRNYYPHDLENTVAHCHGALGANTNAGAAFTIPVDGEERLILVHEMDRHAQEEADELVWAIRQAISKEHQLQVYGIALLARRSLPKTTSGKVQRGYCRQMYLDDQLRSLLAWSMEGSAQT